MALHQTALTKAHLCAWKGRSGVEAGPELLLGSLAQSEKVQCHLPSKTGKTSPSSSRAGDSSTVGMLAVASQGKHQDSQGTGQWLL